MSRPALRHFRAVGTLALLGLVGLVASLDRLVVFDDDLWRTVLLARGCATDLVVDRTVDFATRILTVIFIAATVVHVRTNGFRSAWPWVITCGLGLFASKTLKHLLTRERPSSLPDAALGYSFPSAHVMNSVAAMVAVVGLAQGFRRRNLWAVAASLLTLIVTAGRLLLARHWGCDVVGGVLAALVLVGLVVPAVVRRPVGAPAVLALVLMAAFTVDQWLGASGLRLPAPLIGKGLALVDVAVGERLRPALTGDWREAAAEERVGSLMWLEGSGSVPVEVPAEVAESARSAPIGEAVRSLRLALGGRTERVMPACVTLGVQLNGRSLGRFVPFSGWREYRLPIPPGLLRAGRNELAISAETPAGRARFAVTYVRVGGGSASD